MRAFFRSSCLIGALALASVAHAKNYQFVASSGDWSSPTNWDLNDGTVPGQNDHATIPNTKTCNVSASDESVGYVTINSGGKLHVATGRTLHIYDDNTPTAVDGTLEFDTSTGTSTIQLHNAGIEFSTSGSGVIDARRPAYGTGTALITGASYTLKGLTVGSGVTVKGSVTFDGVSFTNSGALSVDNIVAPNTMTFGSVFGVKLYGGGTLHILDATAAFATIYKETAGTPEWVVTLDGGAINLDGQLDESGMSITVNGGTLTAYSPVSIGGGLTVTDGTVDFSDEFIDGNVDISGGTLEFNAACSPTGDFDISGGTVDVNAALSSSGTISIYGGTLRYDAASTPSGAMLISGGGNLQVNDDLAVPSLTWEYGGTIVVASGKTAVFGQ